jgi:hypothetical protein
MCARLDRWKLSFVHATAISFFTLGLFYYWFAVADRYMIFLYGHMEAAPFDDFTSSRYWMSGLVASGAVMVLYTIANWFLGRVAGLRYRSYCPPAWWQVWLANMIPLVVGISVITMTFNQPTLPLSDAASCVLATLVGLALALTPGPLAAQQPSELGWLTLYGIGVMPILLLLRAIELPSRGLVSVSRAYSLAIGGTLVGVVWLGIMTWLRMLRQKPPIKPSQLLVAGLCLSYLLMPLLHHLLFVPPDYRYISTSSNFFAFDLGVQLLTFAVATVQALGIARLHRWLQDRLVLILDQNK